MNCYGTDAEDQDYSLSSKLWISQQQSGHPETTVRIRSCPLSKQVAFPLHLSPMLSPPNLSLAQRVYKG